MKTIRKAESRLSTRNTLKSLPKHARKLFNLLALENLNVNTQLNPGDTLINTNIKY
jgi:hypothetical protein